MFFSASAHSKKLLKFLSFISVIVFCICGVPQPYFCDNGIILPVLSSYGSDAVYAADDDETIDFRVLATGDLHGQVTAMNYETGVADELAGISKIASLIYAQRKKVGKSNTVMVDAGDCVYDYLSNLVYDKDQTLIQPIYQAMAKIGYDAITPGNHDWDYSREYLEYQYRQTGLDSKAVACNVVDTVTGEEIFSPYRIVTRKAVTSKGNTVSVKIGIIGATKASLSGRRTSYSGILDGLDIYTCVKKQASILKNDEGCDLVIVIEHGGIGILSGSDTKIHPGARIAALSTVDGVVTAHSHETFPLNDGTYDDYPSIVDEKKGLIYNTPVVGTGSHATNLGVLHYTLKVNSDGSLSISDSSSEVIAVTKSTKERKAITADFSSYMALVQSSVDRVSYAIEDGVSYSNMDCVVKDSNLYQLLNDAKISYAKSYILQYRSDLASYPVIAASVNLLDDKQSFINISGSMTQADIASVLSETSPMRDSGYLHIYTITGAKLLEWLEYSASIYASSGSALPSTLNAFAAKSENKYCPLIRSAYARDWSNYFIFDGISYNIDLTQKARYDADGTYRGNYHRITGLTYNGNAVSPSQVFVIAMDSLNRRFSFMPSDDDSIFDYRTWVTGKEVIMNYIRQLSYYGDLNITADYNWRILPVKNYKFTIAVPKENKSYIKSTKWNGRLILDNGDYIYFTGILPSAKATAQKLHVIASEGITTETCQKIPVSVTAITAPGNTVKEIKYMGGKSSSSSNSRWSTAKTCDGTFYVKKNGHYSIMVTDSAGNVAFAHITIDNYNDAILDTPMVNTPTNRLNHISGTCIADSTVYVCAPDGTITSQTSDSKGNFSVTIPLPRANDTYSVWIEKEGKKSSIVEKSVLRTGANIPTANTLNSGSAVITGTCDEYVTISARIGSKVYVAKGEADKYKASSVYKSSYNLYETDITYVKNSNGSISYTIPIYPTASGKVYYIYATDRNGNASRCLTLTAQ